MDAVLAGAVAVLGTLIGSFGTLVLQSREARRAAAVDRERGLRQDRIDACLAFAEALSEHRRAVVNVWLRRHTDRPRDDHAVGLAWQEADQHGARSESAMFRVLLATQDHRVKELARAARDRARELERAADHRQLRAAEQAFEDALDAFVAAAHRLTA